MPRKKTLVPEVLPESVTIFRGIRTPRGCRVICKRPQQRGHQLALKLNIRSHSPTGFEWGYGGSGPAQLALAILWEVLHDRALVEDYYQDFKRVIAGLPKHGWLMFQSDVDWWLTSEHDATACDALLFSIRSHGARYGIEEHDQEEGRTHAS